MEYRERHARSTSRWSSPGASFPTARGYVAKDALLARRAPQVAIGIDVTYGMGLMVDTVYGTPVVHHGGDMIGFHSDMMWLPEHGVGAVILTNGDPGLAHSHRIPPQAPRSALRWQAGGRRTDRRTGEDILSTTWPPERKLLTMPADAADGREARRALHQCRPGRHRRLATRGMRRVFDFGEFSSEVGFAQESRRHHLVYHDRPRLQRAGIRGWASGDKRC